MFDSFGGVKIYIYDFDHPPPPFHAHYAEHKVVIVIETLTVYAGKMPPKKLDQVLKWAADDREKLLKEFETKNPHQHQK